MREWSSSLQQDVAPWVRRVLAVELRKPTRDARMESLLAIFQIAPAQRFLQRW